MRILVVRDSKYWIAHLLEEHLSALDLEIEFAVSKLRKTKLAEDYFLNRYGGSVLKPAPTYLQEQFGRGRHLDLHLPDLFISLQGKDFYYPCSDLQIRIAGNLSV